MQSVPAILASSAATLAVLNAKHAVLEGELHATLLWLQARAAAMAEAPPEVGVAATPALKAPRRVAQLHEALAEQVRASKRAGVPALYHCESRPAAARFLRAVVDASARACELVHPLPTSTLARPTSALVPVHPPPHPLEVLSCPSALQAACAVAGRLREDMEGLFSHELAEVRWAGIQHAADSCDAGLALLVLREWYSAQWIRVQVRKLTRAARGLFSLQPHMRHLDGPAATVAGMARRVRRAESYAAGPASPRGHAAPTAASTAPACAGSAAAVAAREDLRDVRAVFRADLEAEGRSACVEHDALAAAIMPELRALQAQALREATRLLQEGGGSAGAREAAAAACVPFLEAFRLAHVVLVDPTSRGPTVVVLPDMA